MSVLGCMDTSSWLAQPELQGLDGIVSISMIMGADDDSLRPAWAVEAMARYVVRCMVSVGWCCNGCC